jgi:hypothetical protein
MNLNNTYEMLSLLNCIMYCNLAFSYKFLCRLLHVYLESTSRLRAEPWLTERTRLRLSCIVCEFTVSVFTGDSEL